MDFQSAAENCDDMRDIPLTIRQKRAFISYVIDAFIPKRIDAKALVSSSKGPRHLSEILLEERAVRVAEQQYTKQIVEFLEDFFSDKPVTQVDLIFALEDLIASGQLPPFNSRVRLLPNLIQAYLKAADCPPTEDIVSPTDGFDAFTSPCC